MNVPREVESPVMTARVGDDREEDVNVFLVVYELTDLADEDFEQQARLLEAIRSHEAYAQLTRSAWIVKSRGTAADLLETLDRHLMRPDRVFVGTLTAEAAWRNVICGYAGVLRSLADARPPAEEAPGA